MLGFVILFIAIVLYFHPKFRFLSYFLYLSFMMGTYGGLNLWTDSILGVKNMDLAVIYTFVISIYMIAAKCWEIPKWPFRKYYIMLVIVLLLCILFSLVHYGLSMFQIIQGSRNFLLILSLPILISVRQDELQKILKMLLFFCVLTSVLYIIEVISGRPTMPYGEPSMDVSTGLMRFYNSPSNLAFFLSLTFLMPHFFKGKIWIYRALFIAAMACTLGRTFITTTIATVLLTVLMQGKMKRIGTAVISVLIMLTPFIGIIGDRFEGAGGTSDFRDLANGNYRYYENSQDGGTLVYRIAWVYERWEYMKKQPASEMLLGLGLVSDGQPWPNQHYNFSLGLYSEEINNITQLSTPDISYGNLLTKLGLLGSIVYLAFAASLMIFLFKHRKRHPLILLSTALMITAFLISFSGTMLSETKNFALIFMMLSLLYHRKASLSPGIKN